MNKLIKYIGLTSILSTPILIATVATTNNETNIAAITSYSSSFISPEEETFNIYKDLFSKTQVDGSDLKQGQYIDEAINPIWTTIKDLESDAKAKASSSSDWRDIYKLIEGLQRSSISIPRANRNKRLEFGSQEVTFNMEIGKKTFTPKIWVVHVQAAE